MIERAPELAEVLLRRALEHGTDTDRVRQETLEVRLATVLLSAAVHGGCPDADDVMRHAVADGEHADDPLAIGLACHALWDVMRRESRAQVWGVLPDVRGRKARPVSAWSALTPTELRLAALVAEGMSNPEIARRMFSSHRSVQAHVSHILAKCGVRSRMEIVAEAARHR